MNLHVMIRSLLAFSLMFVVMANGAAFAQEKDKAAEEAREKALAKLKTNLEKMSDNVFLREQTLDNGKKFYQLLWEMDGETSKITFELRELGHFHGELVFGILAYTVVAGVEEGSLPPAVIKAVATKNERTGLGYFSMPEKFDMVFMNMTTPSDTLTPAQLWMICGYMHQNRIGFKKEIENLLNASGN
ncbi:hypothetical protein FYZ48_25510 [Gimesia chilikensis]|uniref:hypothetical protein n=1 Tax=Gimesia chilikensis TaxID=2605989 RepID=UPI0011EE3354|nr:hypothetical protein [Gimesia chilikensis]KAA0131505.1 hypothetical protein FYZ48_25510 [Gimesia chilikensis]